MGKLTFIILFVLLLSGNYEEISNMERYTNKSVSSSSVFETENESNVVATQEYKIGEDSFTFYLIQDGTEYRISMICIIEDKVDAYFTHISLNAIMSSNEEAIKPLQDMFQFYFISIGDGYSLTRTNNALIIASEDAKPISSDEYFSVDWILSVEDFESDYGKKVGDFLVDFIKSN